MICVKKVFEILGMTSKITDLSVQDMSLSGSSASYLSFPKKSISKFSRPKTIWENGKGNSGESCSKLIKTETTWGPVGELNSKVICFRDIYEDALHMFQLGDVEAAKVLLLKLKDKFGLDKASELLLERVGEALAKGQKYYKNPEWKGVLRLTEKDF